VTDVRERAIEALMMIAENRRNIPHPRSVVNVVAPYWLFDINDRAVETLARHAVEQVHDSRALTRSADDFAAAASLLYAGWSP